MKKQIIAAIACICFAYSCINSAKNENNNKTEQKVSAETKEDNHNYPKEDSIELNNGAKWKVAKDMLPFIKNMESDVKQFSEMGNKNLKDYIRLSSGLQKNINLLTSNCTMEGKAHDELHKWLLPYIDRTDQLNKSKNEIEAQTTFKEIENSFVVFNTYFE